MPSRFTNEVDIYAYEFPLTAAAVALAGNLAFGVPATGKLAVAPATGLVCLGYFTKDSTGDGTTPVTVELLYPIRAYWFKNAGASPVAFAFQKASPTDGGTVRVAGATMPVIGVALEISATRGVLVATNLLLPAESATTGELASPDAAERRDTRREGNR